MEEINIRDRSLRFLKRLMDVLGFTGELMWTGPAIPLAVFKGLLYTMLFMAVNLAYNAIESFILNNGLYMGDNGQNIVVITESGIHLFFINIGVLGILIYAIVKGVKKRDVGDVIITFFWNCFILLSIGGLLRLQDVNELRLCLFLISFQISKVILKNFMLSMHISTDFMTIWYAKKNLRRTIQKYPLPEGTYEVKKDIIMLDLVTLQKGTFFTVDKSKMFYNHNQYYYPIVFHESDREGWRKRVILVCGDELAVSSEYKLFLSQGMLGVKAVKSGDVNEVV